MSMSDDPRGFRRGHGGSRDYPPRQGQGARPSPPADDRYAGYRQPPEAPEPRPSRKQPEKPQPAFSAYKPEAYAKPEEETPQGSDRPEWDMGPRSAPPPPPRNAGPAPSDPYARSAPPQSDPFYSDAASDPYAPRSPRNYEPEWARDPYPDPGFPDPGYQDAGPPQFPNRDPGYSSSGYQDAGAPQFPSYYPPMDDPSPSGPDVQSVHDRFFASDPAADENTPPPHAGAYRSAFDDQTFDDDDEPHGFQDRPKGFDPEPAPPFGAQRSPYESERTPYDPEPDPRRDPRHHDNGPYASAFDDRQYYDWDRYEQGPAPQSLRPGQGAMPDDDLDADFFADEDDFDDEDFEPERRGGRVKLIAAVLTGAVVVGGGLAYVYKTTSGGSDGTPSLITADSTPVKEEPADPGGRDFPNGNKVIYDRLIGNGSGNTASSSNASGDGSSARLASGGDASSDSAGMGGGVITTGSGTLEERIENALRNQGGGASPDASEGNSPDAPRSVRTMTFGPDGTQRPVESTTQRIAAGEPEGSPDTSNTGVITTSQESGASQGFFTTGRPISSDDSGSSAGASSGPDTETQVAALSPQGTEPEPAATSVNESGYFVQIGARNDRDAAQSALPTLQQRYASVIGGTPSSVRQVDLGAKGVWYRMLVGPFGSKGEADQLCQQLKGAGMRECLSRKY